MKITCKVCNIEYDVNVTQAQIISHACGTLAQDAFDNLNADERELLISGICGNCYDEMFFMDEPDDEEYKF